MRSESGDARAGLPDVDRFRRALETVDMGLWQWDLTTDAVNPTLRAVALLACARRQAHDYAGFIDLVHADDRATTGQVGAAKRRGPAENGVCRSLIVLTQIKAASSTLGYTSIASRDDKVFRRDAGG